MPPTSALQTSAPITEKTKVILPIAGLVGGVGMIIGATAYVVSMGATLNAKVNGLESSLATVSHQMQGIDQKLETLNASFGQSQRVTDSRLATLEAQVSALMKK